MTDFSPTDRARGIGNGRVRARVRGHGHGQEKCTHKRCAYCAATKPKAKPKSIKKCYTNITGVVRGRIRIRIRIHMLHILYDIWAQVREFTYVYQYGNTSMCCTDSDSDSDTRNENHRKNEKRKENQKQLRSPTKYATHLPLAINYALTALRTCTCMNEWAYVWVYGCMGVCVSVWVSVWVRVGHVREWIVTLLGLSDRLCLWFMAERVCELCIKSAFQLGFTIHLFPSQPPPHCTSWNMLFMCDHARENLFGLITQNIPTKSLGNPRKMQQIFTSHIKLLSC